MAGNLAIIGGTGLCELPPELFSEPIVVETPHGSCTLLSVSFNYVEPARLYFLPRHGPAHAIPPHLIDYRANMAALRALDVRWILAGNAVGSLHPQLAPGAIVVPHDFIDLTRDVPATMFDTRDAWRHTDFQEPYSPKGREAITTAAMQLGIEVKRDGVYVGRSGPRFETPAEVRMLAAMGGDVVGMTGLPEAILARELEINYACAAVVTNLGSGLSESAIRHSDVETFMQDRSAVLRELLLRAAAILAGSRIAAADQ